MKILVTGSSGFIGSHLVRRLVADGHTVAGFDIAVPRRPVEGWRDIRGDIRDDATVARAMNEVKPDTVFHLAAQVSVSISMREPRLDIETNVIASTILARAAAAAGAGRFVNTASGGAMFGDAPLVPADDDSPVEPLSVYGASKAAAEMYLRVVGHETGMTIASVRPSNVYGPWQDAHGEAGVVAIFTERMLRGEPVVVFAPGTDTRDYVYVSDIVEAFVLAADAPRGEMCAVGTGLETSTLDLFEHLSTLTGYERQAEIGPARPGDIPRSALDASRARERWGWRPAMDLHEGLRITVEAFREDMGL